MSCIHEKPQEFKDELRNEYEDFLNDQIDKIFENIQLIDESRSKLIDMALDTCIKRERRMLMNNISTGLVFVGFGEEDIFPSLHAYILDGIIKDYLIYTEFQSSNINHQNPAQIVPFAQSEMVRAFMEGINPKYYDLIESYISKTLKGYPKILLDEIDINSEEIDQLKEKLQEISNAEFDRIKKDLYDFKRDNYINPVIDVVARLPKDELAALAESLVNLTSLKRRFSMQEETVGGPIDVAVISKGDGFIWIKRKHYFKAELNPQFFANYYRELDEND